MACGTYKYQIVKHDDDKLYHHHGVRSGGKSKRGFETKQQVRNHVRALCTELNFNSKEVKYEDGKKAKGKKA